MFSAFGAVCETVGVTAMIPLIQVIIMPQYLRENDLLGFIIENLQINSDAVLIFAVGGAVALVHLLKNIILFFVSYVSAKYSNKVQRELSVEMMDSYMKRGYIFL